MTYGQYEIKVIKLIAFFVGPITYIILILNFSFYQQFIIRWDNKLFWHRKSRFQWVYIFRGTKQFKREQFNKYKPKYPDVPIHRVSWKFLRLGGYWKFFNHIILLNGSSMGGCYINFQTSNFIFVNYHPNLSTTKNTANHRQFPLSPKKNFKHFSPNQSIWDCVINKIINKNSPLGFKWFINFQCFNLQKGT